MSGGARIVAGARGAVGAPFRLHGREVADGLDCVGLAACALREGGFEGEVPSGYALRSGDADRVAALIEAAGLAMTREAADGDLLLLRAGPGQLHLAIVVPGGIVHADAAQRRVVERPGVPPWPVLGRFRLGEE